MLGQSPPNALTPCRSVSSCTPAAASCISSGADRTGICNTAQTNRLSQRSILGHAGGSAPRELSSFEAQRPSKGGRSSCAHSTGKGL